MENYIIQYWINKLIIGYTISTITFFLIVLINKSLRQKIKPFLSNSNLILFFVLTINVIINFKQAVLCKNGFDFYNSRICFIPFFINFLFLYLFQMLFVLKKFRENLFLTIFTLISFVLFANFEHFIFFFTSNNPDFLPSKWIDEPNQTEFFYNLFISILYFLICGANTFLIKIKRP